MLQPSPPQAVPPAPGGENGTVGGCVIKGYACNAGYVKWQGKCTKECAASNTEDKKYVRQQDGSCEPCDTGTLPFSSNPSIEPQQCVSEDYAGGGIFGCGYALFDFEPDSIYWTQDRYNAIVADNTNFKEISLAGTDVERYNGDSSLTKRLAIKLEKAAGGYCKCPTSNSKVGKLTPKDLDWVSDDDKTALQNKINTDMSCYSCGYGIAVYNVGASWKTWLHDDIETIVAFINSSSNTNNDIIKVNVGDGEGIYDPGDDPILPQTLNYLFGVKLVPDGLGGCACPPYYGVHSFQTIDVSELDGIDLVMATVQGQNPDYTISPAFCKVVH